MSDKNKDWTQFAPWFLTIACTIVLLIIGLFLIQNIEWFKASVFDPSIQDINRPEYRFYAYHMHLSMIKRSIGLFSGFAIMFLGLGVVFFTLRDKTTLDIKGGGASAVIATASPGIIALIVGAFLIILTIQSKDNFPTYNSGSVSLEKPLDVDKIPKIKRGK